jgi:sporadic carbohydrate cluster protein (TIGR04323 family)
MSTKDWFAYVRSQSAQMPIPQRVQRLLIHEYAAKAGLRVTFYVAEIPAEGIFYNLEHLVLGKPPLAGFVFYSLEQVFPLRAGRPFLEKLIDAGYGAHFALEEVAVMKREDIDGLEMMDAVKRISDGNARALPQLIELSRPLLR